jgi:hypothetical protein
VGAALGQPDQPDLREGPNPLAAAGPRPTERGRIGGSVGHIQTRPIQRQHPQAAIPTTLGLVGGQRSCRLLEQHPQGAAPSRARAWTSADLAGTRQVRQGSRGWATTTLPAALDQAAQDLLVGHPANKASAST